MNISVGQNFLNKKKPFEYIVPSPHVGSEQSIIEPIIQYGIIVCGCCNYTSLLAISIMQKILKYIYFRKRRDSSDDLFIENGILDVFELHLYELFNFSMESVNNLHRFSDNLLKNHYISLTK